MFKTAECVTPKHPDKLCDRISDAIVEECLLQDPHSRVAVETMGGHGIITLTGEVSSTAQIDYKKITETVVGKKYGIQINIVEQSDQIAQGVDSGGAGDQGIMIGYATSANNQYMPYEYYLARDLARYLYKFFPYDGKTQITIDENNNIETIVASYANTSEEKIRTRINERGSAKDVYINPCGYRDICGFEADTGLTGRKLAVDNYGPQIPIGGGCFSGKDPTKVDRSGAYMARKIAVDYLIKLGASEVYVKLAYSIGKKDPVMAVVEIDGKQENVMDYDLSPSGIYEFLDLGNVPYRKTAERGHFGNGFARK